MLDSALDAGISEADFWEMTLAEIERLSDSKKRVWKREAQERASFDYKLAELIGRSVARIHSSSAKFPPIYEVYPTLFDEIEGEDVQEQIQKKKDEVSALRLRLFTQSFNKKFEEVGK